MSASAPGAAVRLADAESTSGASVGGRLEAGYQFDFGSTVALGPRLVGAWARLPSSSRLVTTDIASYTLTTTGDWWVMGLGLELELFQRRLIIAPQVGISHLFESTELVGGGLHGVDRDHWAPLWGRLGVGTRFPSRSPIAGSIVGALELATGDALFITAAARAVVSVGIDLDGSLR